MRPRHLVAAFVAVSLVYLLALGPLLDWADHPVRTSAEAFVIHNPALVKAVKFVYAPVIWSGERCPDLGAMIAGYVDFWERLLN